ncbi:MAG TPA: acyl-homoserine-lactone synthase [Sphingopyxis sp.]|nr:acyl-homoserine-lactone synthase [Sphingopyxis sp.]HMP43830.1 acyl-homoserine-lactone synthase [Sphingopyxis sp.]HMQ18883.1 acyl-homoserine-lactone synthase [Sphingopyxis sp.]
MIHICQGYSLADARLASMFRDRKTLFVDLLGWEVPVIDGQFEIDRYDGADALYLIAADDDGHHMGSMRLLPTEAGHLLADLFPDLCACEIPRGPHVMEITRLCLPQRLGSAGRQWVRNRLISAMVDHALGRGVTLLSGVVTAPYREQVLAMGWRAAALGPPIVRDSAALGAFRLHIDAETPARLAANGIYSPGMIVPAAQAA